MRQVWRQFRTRLKAIQMMHVTHTKFNSLGSIIIILIFEIFSLIENLVSRRKNCRTPENGMKRRRHVELKYA